MTPLPLSIPIDATHTVSGLWQVPGVARACFVFAHGAGAGMHHVFMKSIADGLAERGIGTLRYQFPYMERGAKRTDPPRLCHATVRAAVAEAQGRAPELLLLAGGKSFGGRMTSQAQAAEALPHVAGLAFLGFPLHAAGQPSATRGEHLDGVSIPMLFLQGTRDRLADLDVLEPLIARLGDHATLQRFDGADHSFHVPARSGRTDADVRSAMLDAFSGWVESLLRRGA